MPSPVAMASGDSRVVVRDLGFTLLSAGTVPEAEYVKRSWPLSAHGTEKLLTNHSVFFIHGLQGHPRGTWTYPPELSKRDPLSNGSSWRYSFRRRLGAAFRSQASSVELSKGSDKQVFWPHDLLPESYPNLRIFTYGYDSHVTHWFKGPAMQLDILDYGESLLTGLVAKRRECPDRPIIFVVHSLGGLVMKDVGLPHIHTLTHSLTHIVLKGLDKNG